MSRTRSRRVPWRCFTQVLDAEAEYLAAEAAAAAKEAAEAGGAAEAVKSAVERLSAGEMKVLLRQYVQQCVDERERERAAEAALREAQLEVAAKARALQQVEASLRTKENDFDRRVSARHVAMPRLLRSSPPADLRESRPGPNESRE